MGTDISPQGRPKKSLLQALLGILDHLVPSPKVVVGPFEGFWPPGAGEQYLAWGPRVPVHLLPPHPI